MRLQRVSKDQMPEGHYWAIIERGGETLVLAVDQYAARIACGVLAQRGSVELQQVPGQ